MPHRNGPEADTPGPAAEKRARADAAAPPDQPDRTDRAVFLDRDGVLIADVHHLTSVEQIRLLPKVPEALARLRAAGWRLIVATNQSVVARGWITEEELGRIHLALLETLRSRGAEIDAVYYCPHHPEGALARYRRVCDCRKPSPGMLLRAAREWRLDLARCVIVGDAATDIEAGWRAGCRAILVRGAQQDPPADRVAASEHSRGGHPPDFVASDLWGATEWVLAHVGPRRDSLP
jgi:D-glycero-D-manno-heptose 1,7-bisphosphate phosphatase